MNFCKMEAAAGIFSRNYFYLAVILLCTLSKHTEAANSTIFAGETVPGLLIVAPGDSTRISNFIENAYHYLKGGVNKFKSAKSCIDSAYNYCEKNKIKIPAELQLLSASYSFEIGDYSAAEEQMTTAENNARATGKYNILARVLIFKGSYHLRTRFFAESREAYEQSIEVANKYKLKGVAAEAYHGIANVMNDAGDIKGFRTYLAKMIEVAMKQPDTLQIEEGLLRLGNSYIEIDRNDRKVDSLLKKCLWISILSKDSLYSAFSSANIGYNFYLNKQYDSSRFYYKYSLEFSIPARLTSISANSLGNLGTIYRDLGYPATALGFYRKSLDLAKKLNDWYTLAWVNDDMSKLYLLKGDTGNAYRKFVLYKQYNDSTQNKRTTQGLADARLRYEADTHRKEIDLLNLRLKNNRFLNWGFSVLIVFTLVIGYFLFTILKSNNRRRLSEMNRRISEITQANLRQQMNPHFIFNTLNSIQYFMYQHDKLATNNYLTMFSNLIRKVLENSQHTSIPLTDELDALKLYLELESLRFTDKFDYEINLDEEIDPILYKIPTMLIQPYVENSIGHGIMPLDKKGHLEITIKLGQGKLICSIEDNGIGREAAMEIKKAKGTNHNSLGTQITNSRLNLVNSFYGTDLKVVYTDLRDENDKASGTLVEIQIPIIT